MEWGCKSTTSKEKLLFTSADFFNVCMLNTGEGTRLNLITGETSPIDLTFCSTALLPILLWEVLPFICNSDRAPIIITNTNFKSSTDTNITAKWNFRMPVGLYIKKEWCNM